MKKIVILLGIVGLCTLTATAQTKQKKITISNTRIVQASSQAIVLKYAGIDIVVPQGQTVLLGQRSDGSVIVRGLNLSNLQINNGIISTKGYSVFSVDPESSVVFLNRGTALTLENSTRTESATIYPGQAVYTEDPTITSETAPALQAAAAQETTATADLAAEIPAFVAETETSSAASEQATQDVIETEEELSKSAP